MSEKDKVQAIIKLLNDLEAELRAFRADLNKYREKVKKLYVEEEAAQIA